MADENERKEPQPESDSDERGRRFRLTRKVKPRDVPKDPAPVTREEKELRQLAEMGDDADRGTPEEDASLRAGCTSMVRVVMLFFVVMFGSIVATWCIKR
ncbi:MAG: hypothetical protein ACOY94_04560 [Bacillota bacterium]